MLLSLIYFLHFDFHLFFPQDFLSSGGAFYYGVILDLSLLSTQVNTQLIQIFDSLVWALKFVCFFRVWLMAFLIVLCVI